VTFLANPYSWSSWFLGVFEEEGSLWEARKEAEELLNKKDPAGVKLWSKDGQWFLYINLVKPREDVHSIALEEVRNPSLVNWDDFMLDKEKVGKYQIIYAVQDYYFCEVGERKVFKRYLLMHFSRNWKETSGNLVNFCFSLEEVAKSRLKNCRLRKKEEVMGKWWGSGWICWRRICWLLLIIRGGIGFSHKSSKFFFMKKVLHWFLTQIKPTKN
jgi:hypothetical protein